MVAAGKNEDLRAVVRRLTKRGLLRARDAVEAGVPRAVLGRMVEAGELQRVSRGLYARADAELPAELGLIVAQRRAPRSVICLLSALQFHELTTQAPHEVWLAVDDNAWRSDFDYPPLRIVHATGKALTYGVGQHKIAGERIRVTSAAKTVADCFKHRNKIGLDVALEALRDYRKKRGSMDELWKAAEVDRVARVMRPYIEALA